MTIRKKANENPLINKETPASKVITGIRSSRKKYRITLVTDMLGTIPKDKETYNTYIAEHARQTGKVSEEILAGEIADVPEPTEGRKGGETGFKEDADGIYIQSYQFNGFIRNAANVLKDPSQIGVKNLRSKVREFVFVDPFKIRLFRKDDNGKIVQVTKNEGKESRSLRAETMQGPRVTIMSSDALLEGCFFDVEIEILDNKENIDFKMLEVMFDYGSRQGLLQWRNAGYGRFTWEPLSK